MIGLNRLVGIMMAGGLTASQSSTMQDMGGNMLDVVRVSVTQYELAQVRTAVATECIFGGKTKVLKDFPAFVRDNMSAKGRDPGTDFWETLYWAEAGHRHLLQRAGQAEGLGRRHLR